MSAIVKAAPQQAVAVASHNPFVPHDMDGAMRLALIMSKSKMLPDHIRGDEGTCLMIIEQAMRWRMSPFAVAQSTSSIKGKLMFEGKLIAAAIEASGAIDGLFDYQFKGEGPSRTITVLATRRGEDVPRPVVVALKDAATENPLWKRQPDQQLVYYGVRVWGRRWTPGVVLGVNSREEFDQAERDGAGGGAVDAQFEPVTVTEAEPVTEKRKETIADFLNNLDAELLSVDAEALGAILARDRVQNALDQFKNGARERLLAMINAATERTSPSQRDDDFPGDRP